MNLLPGAHLKARSDGIRRKGVRTGVAKRVIAAARGLTGCSAFLWEGGTELLQPHS